MKPLKQIYVPQDSVNDTKLTVVGIIFKSGDFIKKGQTIIELETSKAVLTIESDTDGYIYYHCVIGQDVEVNKLIIEIFESQLQSNNLAVEKIIDKVIDEKVIEIMIENEKQNASTIFSHEAISLIKTNNLKETIFNDLYFVDKKIVEEKLGITEKVKKIEIVKELTNSTKFDNTEIKKVSSSKVVEIEYLSEVQACGLTSTLDIQINMVNFFESVNPHIKFLKGSPLPVIVFEVSRLLKKYNLLNSYFDNNHLHIYNEINIGIAIDINQGLKVAKIKNTDTFSVKEIDNKLYTLANLYLDKTLTKEDLTGSTFTITDLSGTTIYSFRPLVNKFNSAILGISNVDKATNKMILNMSFDHRVTEGKYVAEFLSELKERLESYSFQKNQSYNSKIQCSKCSKKLKDDINELGFIKIINKYGEDKYICETCLFS